MKQKLAILGASYLQKPLVDKAKELGYETHVFAWKEGNVVEDIADFYYSISILDKNEILKICTKVGINAITSIASDMAMPTVNYVADKLGLVGNPVELSLLTTNKYQMRKALSKSGLLCPLFTACNTPDFNIYNNKLKLPIVVKPTDSSGSRGVTYVNKNSDINKAIEKSLQFSETVIVEEFIKGREFSVETISFKGKHYMLAVTDKVTTGTPYFVEIEHHQPANITDVLKENIFSTIKKALSALGVVNGAGHSEILITADNKIYIVEIGARMGGDFIGSDLVQLSTGYDFVKGVIDVAFNKFTPINYPPSKNEYSGVYFVYSKPEKDKIYKDSLYSNNCIVKSMMLLSVGDYESLDESGKRVGVVVYSHPLKKQIINPSNVLGVDI
ncbi:MAG: ATP-grasp domain-containing protein [Ichthyobacteriaceae bacterium]|nr:ATP-grasp domain-containing protein [Ichthyobacteriaceae bacterium]